MSVRRASRAAIVALAGLAGSACGLFPGETAGESVASVVAARADLRLSVPATGFLSAVSASPIAVPQVPTGALKVKELAAEGSIVAAGDIIVVFDDTQLAIERDNHRASFRSTNRQIDRNTLQSEIDGGQIETMRTVAELERDTAEIFGDLDNSIYSRKEVLGAEVRKTTAEETIVFADASLLLRGEYYDIEERILAVERDQVRGRIERVETSLGQLVLKSPLGGLVLYKKNWRGAATAVGDTIWPGNVILSIVDPSRTSLAGFLLEKDAAAVQKGAEATIVVDADPGRPFRGRVTMVAELSRPIERGSPVKYTEVKIDILDGDPKLLKPGMKAEARIVVGTLEHAVVIPRSAVRGEGDDTWVLLASDEGPKRHPVKLGLGNLVRVSVEDGLSGGERLLLGGEEPDRQPAETGGTAPSAAAGG